MLYLEDKQQQNERIGCRRDSLSLLRVIARTPNNPDTLTRNIPSGPVVCLPAHCDDIVSPTNEDQTMEMFQQDKSEVTAMFTEWGSINVIFSQTLTKGRIKAFSCGVAIIPGVARAETIPAPEGHTGFIIVMRHNAAKRAFDIRGDVAAYAREFVTRLKPEAVQASLF